MSDERGFVPPINVEHTVVRFDGSLDPDSDPTDPDQQGADALVVLQELVESGATRLGMEIGASRIHVSPSRKIPFPKHALNADAGWRLAADRRWTPPVDSSWLAPAIPTALRKAIQPEFQRQVLERTTGTIASPAPLEHFLKHVDLSLRRDDAAWLYMAELHTRPAPRNPESLIEKVWNECLGPEIILFDPAARKDLIEHGRKHPDLERHIEKWEEMKRAGSKYVVGDESA